MRADLRNKVFSIRNQNDFLSKALEVFDYQYNKNAVYQDFINSLGKKRDSVKNLSDIPFLPAEFFRNHKIVTGDYPVEMIFESSGTTGTSTRQALCN